MTPSPATPKKLGRAGRRLWSDVVTGYELRPDELVHLRDACRTADVIAELEAEVASVEGVSWRLPLWRELRLQRLALVRLLARLNLPDGRGAAPAGAGESESSKARRAARARWDGRAAG